MSDPRREPFDWLDDAQLRHGGLRMIQTAIARGWLEGDEHAGRRAKLVDALARLAHDPATPDRDMLQASRLLALSVPATNLGLPQQTGQEPTLCRGLVCRRGCRRGELEVSPDRSNGRGQHQPGPRKCI